MDEVKIIDVKRTILEDNDLDASNLSKELKNKGTLLINLMSSPGSGKTTTLIKTIKCLEDKLSIGVMEADIDSDVDAKKIKEETKAEAIQLHTGGMCHLDASMTREGLSYLGEHDLVFLENVGNLVCPAEFATGASKCAMILAVTEGDDKPLKYPLMFSICDVILINKIDVIDYFDFDMNKVIENIKKINNKAKIIPICAKSGEGILEFSNWINDEVRKWKEEK